MSRQPYSQTKRPRIKGTVLIYIHLFKPKRAENLIRSLFEDVQW